MISWLPYFILVVFILEPSWTTTKLPGNQATCIRAVHVCASVACLAKSNISIFLFSILS